MAKRKRLNVTRRAGRIYFRRETRRLHDGTADGEILWIMSSDRKPRKVSFVTMCKNDWRPDTSRNGMVWTHTETYRCFNPIAAAKAIRSYLYA